MKLPKAFWINQFSLFVCFVGMGIYLSGFVGVVAEELVTSRGQPFDRITVLLLARLFGTAVSLISFIALLAIPGELLGLLRLSGRGGVHEETAQRVVRNIFLCAIAISAWVALISMWLFFWLY